jgi:GNAT superfamily N-acetyltransferase
VSGVEIREIEPQDRELVHRHWAIGKAAADATRPYDFHVPWESAWVSVSQGRDDLEQVLLGAFDGDQMCGAARVQLPVYDNLHAAMLDCATDPSRLRQGIGTALVEAACEVARGRGRRLVMGETYAPVDEPSAGLRFGEAMGFTVAIEDAIKVVDLLATEGQWAALEDRIAGRYDGYRIVTWHDRIPDELLDGYARLCEMFVDEAPMGELEIEAEKWDEDRIRKREARNQRESRHEAAAGAVDADGRLVAFTEALVNEHAPTWGMQSGTLVDPAHRGHSLGLAIKLANHHQIRSLFPQCRVLVTGNADVNAPMNAVNEVLGYAAVERCIELQRDL